MRAKGRFQRGTVPADQCGTPLAGGWLCVLTKGHPPPCRRVLDMSVAELEREVSASAVAAKDSSFQTAEFGPCPACGAELAVTHDKEFQPTAVLHVEPQCARFAELEADAFLLWVLTVREAQRRADGDA